MVVVAPDPLEVYRLFLLTCPDVVAITGQRVSVTLSGPEPAVRLAAVGGAPGQYPGHSIPRLQVEAWGHGAVRGDPVDDGTASRLARTLVACLPDGEVITAKGTIAAAWVDGLPFASPDPQGRARYIVQVRLDLYPPAAPPAP